MRHKALTVRAPWAHLIAQGFKRLEIRKRPTRYRGPLLICAGLKASESGARFVEQTEVDTALAAPRGVTLCLVDVVDCVRVSELPIEQLCDACCDVESSEYAWVLANPRPVRAHPVRGQQGFFWVESDE